MPSFFRKLLNPLFGPERNPYLKQIERLCGHLVTSSGSPEERILKDEVSVELESSQYLRPAGFYNGWRNQIRVTRFTSLTHEAAKVFMCNGDDGNLYILIYHSSTKKWYMGCVFPDTRVEDFTKDLASRQ